MAVLVAGASAPASVRAQASAWIDTSYLVFESAKTIDGEWIGSQRFAVKPFGRQASVLDAGLPPRTAVEALSVDAQDVYVVTAVSWARGGTRFTPRDVLRITSGVTPSVHVAGRDLGLPDGSRITALSVRSGEMLFALDVHAAFEEFEAAPSDILRWDGALSVAYRGAGIGLPAAARIAGIERTATGTLLFAFSGGVEIGGLAAMPGDLLEYHPDTNSWSRKQHRSQLGLACSPCDLIALGADTDATVIFKSGMERQ